MNIVKLSKKQNVLIIEAEDKENDPGSEGRFVKHMLDLMDIKNVLVPARTKVSFLDVLSSVEAKYKIVHIAAHGTTRTRMERKKFIGFWTPDGKTTTVEEIAARNIDLSGKSVISTACHSGQKEIRKAFKDAVGCKHYIALIGGPCFYNASLMSHIFYHKSLVLRKSVEDSFLEYSERYKNPHKFCFI
jgi:hypothetical protein